MVVVSIVCVKSIWTHSALVEIGLFDLPKSEGGGGCNPSTPLGPPSLTKVHFWNYFRRGTFLSRLPLPFNDLFHQFLNSFFETYDYIQGLKRSGNLLTSIMSSPIAKKKAGSLSISWTMVFCYQNCSDLLWGKIVLVIEKNFWNSRLKAENLQNFWDH